MSQIILIIVGIVIVAILLTRKGRETAVGICVAALDQTVRKSANKEKIIAFLAERGEASNAELAGRLGVSSRTIVNYLDDLEAERKVEQIGDVGRGAHYRLKKQ